MRWEIEGEIYLQSNHYDEYDTVEPYIITKHMDRSKIIYKDVGDRFVNGSWQFDKLKKEIVSGLSLSQWIEAVTGLTVADITNHYEFFQEEKYKGVCSKAESSFQPQTKKVRITIEEIE